MAALEPHRNPADHVIRDILAHPRRIAVVGCSPDPTRDSYRIGQLLIDRGHDVVPVNPKTTTWLGRPCYADLRQVPGQIDVVDIFRRAERAGEVVDAAIARGVPIIWMQLGVVDDDAAARARAVGCTVVMDRCPAIEYRRLF